MSFSGSVLISAVNIVLPAIQKDFSINTIRLSWISPAVILGVAAAPVQTGRMADIYDPTILNYWHNRIDLSCHLFKYSR